MKKILLILLIMLFSSSAFADVVLYDPQVDTMTVYKGRDCPYKVKISYDGDPFTEAEINAFTEMRVLYDDSEYMDSTTCDACFEFGTTETTFADDSMVQIDLGTVNWTAGTDTEAELIAYDATHTNGRIIGTFKMVVTDDALVGAALTDPLTGAYIFKTIAVSGQTSVVADSVTDTLTLAGGGITAITTTAGSDTVTITSTEVDGSTTNEIQNLFQTIDASSGTDPVADTSTDTLTVSGAGIVTVTGDSTTDTLTITGTEVDGSTSNEINTITGDNAATTSGLAITIAGGGINTTAVAGNTVTVTGTEVDGVIGNEYPTAGTYTDISSSTNVDVDTTEMNSMTFGDNSVDNPAWTIDVKTGTSPVVTWGNASMALTGNISATNLSGTNTGDDDVPEAADYDSVFSGASGFLKKTGVATYTLDTSTYLTAESDPLAVKKTDYTAANDVLVGSGVGTYTAVSSAGWDKDASNDATAGGAFHDGFSDFVANEHIDWTADQGATNIHAGNYTDTDTDDQTAAEVAVTTTSFGGEFANNASHDTVQECLDVIDDHDHSGVYEPAGITASDISDKNAGTDITADLEEESHAAEHAVSAADTVFPADPNADKVLMWDDDPGALVWTDNGSTTADKDLVGTAPVTINGGTNVDNILIGADSDVTIAVSAATTSASGVSELAIASEVTTGTSDTLAVTPDALAGSDYGKRVVSIILLDEDTSLTTGDGVCNVKYTVPSILNGWNLVGVGASMDTVSSSGTPTIQIYNLTQTADMLSTRITIDENELTSYSAATAAVIDGANDDVATSDRLRFDVDTAGTGSKGLQIDLVFQLP